MNIMGYELVGGGACPEQYEVFDEEHNMVAYLRLRHGRFTAECPDSGGTLVYSAQPSGDGCFDYDEQDYFLTEAIKCVAEHLGKYDSAELAYYREKYNNEYALR